VNKLPAYQLNINVLSDFGNLTVYREILKKIMREVKHYNLSLDWASFQRLLNVIHIN
jgi:hypothetical protein